MVRKTLPLCRTWRIGDFGLCLQQRTSLKTLAKGVVP
jgi:hypothetical protein